MRKFIILSTLLLILLLMAGVFGCASEQETPTPSPVISPTPTIEPLPTPTPTPEPVTKVFNITRQLSGLDITLVMATWTGNEVELQWTIENPTAQRFKASRLYSIFQPSLYAIDQAGNEAEYFIPQPIMKDLEAGESLIYRTKLLFYTQSTSIKIRLTDAWSEGSTFVDISKEFNFSR